MIYALNHQLILKRSLMNNNICIRSNVYNSSRVIRMTKYNCWYLEIEKLKNHVFSQHSSILLGNNKNTDRYWFFFLKE